MIALLAVHQGGGVGGAPVSLLKLLAALDRTQFESHALFTEQGGVVEYARELGVSAGVVPMGGAFFYSAHARLEPRGVARFIRTFPSAVRTASRELRARRPDLLHLNTSVLLAWAAAARRERTPVVWVVREVLGPNRTLRNWHARYILRHARRVVAISGAVRECFPPHARVDVVHNAVDLSEFRPDIDAKAVRTELGIAPHERVVMLIGSVQQAKGHWLALESFAQLRAPARLVLVTGGVSADYGHTARGLVKRALGLPLDNLDALLRSARRSGVDDRVLVTGFRRDIPRMLATSDVLVFPSLAPEGFGRPIIEAMAMARPVVATDVGPSRELLGPDSGLLVPPQPAALAGALERLLEDPSERARLGQHGRARVEACFALDRQVTAMSAIYRGARG
ncbi:MAG TPA: glycosyltransferase family 4 protein [Chloroflexota bacterium]